MTVFIAGFIASVYIADILAEHASSTFLSGYASLSQHFEFLGSGIAAIFAITWVAALVFWKRRGRIGAFA
jgi:nickel/cobalt transporter (NiCoT) family protein